MFDVSFTEMMIIGVVALIVIGPERLPKVARTIGLLLGRFRRYVGDVKADINREIQLDELKKMQQQVVEQAQSMGSAVNEQMKSIETSLNDSIASGIETKSTETAGAAPAAAPVIGAPSETPKP